MDALEAQKEFLPPESVVAIEQSLEAIEVAVADIRVALSDSPGNPGLERMLVAARRNEVNFLQRIVSLSSGK